MEEEGGKSCSLDGDTVSAVNAVTERETEMELSEEDGDYDYCDEEGIEEEEGDYALKTFDVEMNPLDFMDDEDVDVDIDVQPFQQDGPVDYDEDVDADDEDMDGDVQPYQQDGLVDYETLAVKKRKALVSQGPETSRKKFREEENEYGATMEKMMELMNHGGRRRRKKKLKKKGRRLGSKKQLSPEITKKLGEATFCESLGRYAEAIALSNEVILIAPHLPDPYHILGSVYKAIGEDKKAFNCYMFAAKLSPRDTSLWETLVTLSVKQGNDDLVVYCLNKAISAADYQRLKASQSEEVVETDFNDIKLRLHCASLYMDIGNYKKAAETYDRIIKLCPLDAELYNTAAKLHMTCGQVERAISILEDYMKVCGSEPDLRLVYLLASICMNNNEHSRALQYITQLQSQCGYEELPLHLTVKVGICHVYLGNIEKAEAMFGVFEMEKDSDCVKLITEVADSYMKLSHHESALKYYLMLQQNAEPDDGNVYVRIARCYLGLNDRVQATQFFRKALRLLPNNVDARLLFASVLHEDNKEDEVISLLSPPTNSEELVEPCSDQLKPWWANAKVKLTLANTYQSKGMTKEFVDAIFPLIHETLLIESTNRRIKSKKVVSNRMLQERAQVLQTVEQPDNVFHVRPIGRCSELVKASRAKRLLEKRGILRKEKKAAVLAAGHDWYSDESDEEFPREVKKEPPMPNLLTDAKNIQLIVDVAKALESLQKYWEALEIVNLTLALGHKMLAVETKKELQTLGAQIDYNITDSRHGYDFLRHIIYQHPYSIAAWNRYYKATARSDSMCSKHSKFLRTMRSQYKDCVPPIIISGHQDTMDSRHQSAATYYLHAYKLLPESPLINLCVGTALINLALNFRLVHKHICVTQGLAFLYNNLKNCKNSQEALYNIARAYHHVGLVTLAASHYEKVIASLTKNALPADCNLRREAAYNLHLIYKNSGAIDLARQVLKDHCTL